MKSTHKTIKEKQVGAFEVLKPAFGYKNTMQVPRLTKVVVGVGTGSVKDKKKNELIADRLGKITGQKPALRSAKQSIATFKLRQGEPVGYQVTLRGPRMHGFLEKVLNIAFPRTKDFRGVSGRSVDEMGNITLGIKEHTVFPETSDEELKDVFGMGVTVVTTAKNRKEATAFFSHLGFPFKKEEEKGKKR